MLDDHEPDHYDIFVSYARADDEHGRIGGFVADLQAAYHAHTGRTLRIFFDRSSLRPAERWAAGIQSALRNSGLLLPVLSSAFLASTWCAREFGAFCAEEAVTDGRVLPVRLVDRADPVRIGQGTDGWHRDLLAHQWAELVDRPSGDPEYPGQLDALVRHIRSVLEPAIRDTTLAALPVAPELNIERICFGAGPHAEVIGPPGLVHLDLPALVPKELVAFDGTRQLLPRRVVDAGIVAADRLPRVPHRIAVRGRRRRGCAVAVLVVAGVAYLQGVDRRAVRDGYEVGCSVGRGGIADFVDRTGGCQDWNPLVLGDGDGTVGAIVTVELDGSVPVRRSEHCVVVRAGIRYPDDVWRSVRTGRAITSGDEVLDARFAFQSRQPDGASTDVFAADFDGENLVNLTAKPTDAYDGFFDDRGQEIAEWVDGSSLRISSMRAGRRVARVVTDRPR